ncbi:MAG: SpoIIE family protein phosphatase, partial [Ignavibacteria bacterium]|nr:SpoIIE family protein phosphatase [Ignavibacteria bacterium]
MMNRIENLEQLSIEVGEIFFGSFFLLIGIISIGIALIRRGKDFKILVWLALWIGIYGIRLLIDSKLVLLLFPIYLIPYFKFASVSISYIILIFGLLTWVELTQGLIKKYLIWMVYIATAIAAAGIGSYIFLNDANLFMLYNNLIAVSTLATFIIIIFFKNLSGKYLILPSRGILAVGISVFMVEALYSNLVRFLGYKTIPLFGWIGFTVLIFSMAYAAAKMIFSNERKLIEIEKEMETARQIQKSILPKHLPGNNNLSIAASYYPMTAVAGDYYDFIEIDKNRTGFLIADVSGHGVPAALIASMIKVAMQSLTDYANDPGKLLKVLGNILFNQLNDQFVTASYLF